MTRTTLLLALLVACDGGGDGHSDDTAPSDDTGSAPVDACDEALGVPCDDIEQAYLKGSSLSGWHRLGNQVAMDGDTLAVTAAGIEDYAAVYVFAREGDTWVEEAYLVDPNPGEHDPHDPYASISSLFGWSLSLSGDTLAIGASREDSGGSGAGADPDQGYLDASGAAYVYTRSDGTWSQQAFLKAPVAREGQWFGQSLAVQGDLLAVSAPNESRSEGSTTWYSVGRIYLYARDGGSWAHVESLQRSGDVEGEQLGARLDLDGDALVASSAAGVIVFRRSSSGVWSESEIVPQSGWHALDLDGDTLVVGNTYDKSTSRGIDGDETDTSGNQVGAAWVYTFDGTAWTQQAYLKAANADSGDRFGHSVSLDGDLLAVGAPGEAGVEAGLNGDDSSNVASDAGAIYLFERTGGSWAQTGYLKAPVVGSDDFFGQQVALQDGLLLAGAPGDDSSARTVDGEADDDAATEAGAAWLFRVAP